MESASTSSKSVGRSSGPLTSAAMPSEGVAAGQLLADLAERQLLVGCRRGRVDAGGDRRWSRVRRAEPGHMAVEVGPSDEPFPAGTAGDGRELAARAPAPDRSPPDTGDRRRPRPRSGAPGPYLARLRWPSVCVRPRSEARPVSGSPAACRSGPAAAVRQYRCTRAPAIAQTYGWTSVPDQLTNRSPARRQRAAPAPRCSRRR